MNLRIRILTLLTLATPWLATAKPTLELRDGDRVVFIGGVFMERESEESHIETMLTAAHRDRHITFRNLGWGGDTVQSHLNPNIAARPRYVSNVFGYVEKLKPTVIFVSYGMMESFEGEAGLEDFVRYYNQLLERLSATTSRLVLVSPFPHENLGGHWPDPAGHNRNLKLYVEAARDIAARRGLVFVDLFNTLQMGGGRPLTSNGVHLNNAGYEQAAGAIAKELGLNVRSNDFTEASALREAIKHKNKQWWYHYRPMNSEYVYPGGSRYQLEIAGFRKPLYSEIEEFAALTEKGDAAIAQLRNTRSSRPVESRKAEIQDPKARVETAPDPELERKTFTVADGFQVELFAADPLINKPVQIAFDERGRLWIASTTLYPQIQPGQTADDKIIILEDTNGDGRADKTIVFADDLYIPTGILPGNGGAYVFDDTTLLFYKDTDGDGRADTKEIVLSGFGTEDSHHKGHVLRWGPGGKIYLNQGVFLHSTIETAHGIVAHSGHWLAGIFEYDPATGKLEVYLATSGPPNPWGHYWNDWGFDFHIDSSGQAGSNFILPTANKTSSAIPVPGGQGKLAGAEIVGGRHLPEDWQGNLVSSPFKENRVARWAFSNDGSGYALKPLPPLIVSTDTAFRPVESRMGPDGAIYIADWYNPLIGHMQHHFRDPARDKTHGRIWRVTAKDRPLVPPIRLAEASTGRLLDFLKAPESFTREHARRLLGERNPQEVLPALAIWTQNLNPTDPDYDHHRVEALWVYTWLHRVEPSLLKSVLRAQTPDARAAAAALIRNWHRQLPDALSLLEAAVADDHPRVRLQAVISLSHIPEQRAMEIAVRALDKSTDRYIEEALRNTVIALRPHWEPALDSGALTFDGDVNRLEFVMRASHSRAGVKAMLPLVGNRNIPLERRARAVETVAALGSSRELAELYYVEVEDELQRQVVSGLVQAARDRKITARVNPARLRSWMASADTDFSQNALRLAGAWKVEGARDALAAIARSDAEPLSKRQSAVEALASLGREQSVRLLQELNRAGTPMPLRYSAVAGLAEIDLPTAARNAAALLAQHLEIDAAPILNAFLQRKDGANVLAAALRENPISADNAKLALRAMQSAGRQDESLLTVFASAAGLDAEPRELTQAELRQLAAEVQAKGDPVRGEHVYRRPDLSCMPCHAIAGAGGHVGPDLSAVGSGSTLDYIIESIVAPNKIVKDGFESVEVVTTGDDYILGIKVRSNSRELVLKDAMRAEIVIPRAEIKEQIEKTVSIMPAGLDRGLTHSEFLDLCRFLAELGKPGPFANDPRPVVRRWRILGPVPMKEVLREDNALPWMPAYSLVSGLLPLEDLRASSSPNVLARCEVEVTTPGKIQFRINSAAGLKLWVNDRETSVSDVTQLELPRGMHALTFLVDLKAREQGLRVEFDQVPGSPGRFQLVGGL